MGGHIVLVVQNPETHEHLVQGLAGDGYCALCFRSVEEAATYLAEPGCPACVIVFNIAMRRQSDFAVIAELRLQRPEVQCLFVADEGMCLPDFVLSYHPNPVILDKPLNHPDSAAILRNALQSAPSLQSTLAETEANPSSNSILPYSEEFLKRVGLAEVPVLLSGETGVGKEVMARKLRAYSKRADKPFLKLNCAALPPELAESELFGCAKGAFTGAIADRQGRFETADGGTILLDEIGDMDLRLQTKLLHVLQDGEIQPLGTNRTIKVNVRVMAATHRDLTKAIHEGTFREDLYYRLNVIKIVIPPLRERRDEILPLAETFLTRHLPPGHKAPVISLELRRFLTGYAWPGNVRELENVMRRFHVYQDPSLLLQELRNHSASEVARISLAQVGAKPDAASNRNLRFSEASGDVADKPALGKKGPGRGTVADSPDRLDRLAEASRIAETEVLLEALESKRWNRRQAAASLQIEYKAFLYKLQKYGIVQSKIKRREISA